MSSQSYSSETNWRELFPALPDIAEIYPWIEANGRIIYPVLVLGTITLIILALLSLMRRQDMDGKLKDKIKAELITELRLQVVGVTAEELARTVGLETFKTVRLLEEMQNDGVLISYNNTQRRQVWRLKGIGDAA